MDCTHRREDAVGLSRELGTYLPELIITGLLLYSGHSTLSAMNFIFYKLLFHLLYL